MQALGKACANHCAIAVYRARDLDTGITQYGLMRMRNKNCRRARQVGSCKAHDIADMIRSVVMSKRRACIVKRLICHMVCDIYGCVRCRFNVLGQYRSAINAATNGHLTGCAIAQALRFFGPGFAVHCTPPSCKRDCTQVNTAASDHPAIRL